MSKIPTNNIVSELKDLIKTTLAPQLDDIAASELALWRVSIPDDDDDDDDDESPALLIKVCERSRLKATHEISKCLSGQPSQGNA